MFGVIARSSPYAPIAALASSSTIQRTFGLVSAGTGSAGGGAQAAATTAAESRKHCRNTLESSPQGRLLSDGSRPCG
jgi:hypothetical protein